MTMARVAPPFSRSTATRSTRMNKIGRLALKRFFRKDVFQNEAVARHHIPVGLIYNAAHRSHHPLGFARHTRCRSDGLAPLRASRTDGVGGHELFKVVRSEFPVQRRSTHFQVPRHTGQIPSMHTDRFDNQFHFSSTVSSP